MIVRHRDHECRIVARDDLTLERIGETHCCGSEKNRSDKNSHGDHFHDAQITSIYVSATENDVANLRGCDWLPHGVVGVDEPLSASFNSSSGRSSSETSPPRGVSISVISTMTMATRTGKTNRSRAERRPEVPAW